MANVATDDHDGKRGGLRQACHPGTMLTVLLKKLPQPFFRPFFTHWKKISESGVWDTVGMIRFSEENRAGVYVHGAIIAQKGPGAVALQMLNGLQRLKSLWREEMGTGTWWS